MGPETKCVGSGRDRHPTSRTLIGPPAHAMGHWPVPASTEAFSVWLNIQATCESLLVQALDKWAGNHGSLGKWEPSHHLSPALPSQALPGARGYAFSSSQTEDGSFF